MLSGKILNSDALLNNYKIIGTKYFLPGESFKIVIQVFDDELDIRYTPPSAATRKIIFTKQDGTQLIKLNTDITLFTDDRSIMSVNISDTESLDLQGGNFSFLIDVNGDGTEIKKGLITIGLGRELEGSDCACC